MKIRILSDLHVHRRNFFDYNYANEDLVVAAGDIAEGMGGIKYLEAMVPSKIPVLYVPGNHEYYGENFYALNDKFREHNANNLSNVKVLLNDVYETDKHLFVGSTLWTDFEVDGHPEYSKRKWKEGLNDSKYISTYNGLVEAEDVVYWNHEALNFLDRVYSTKRMILITHYAPKLSMHAQYEGDPLNPGFLTDIPRNLHNKFYMHIHGHTHSSMDYKMENGVRVICNPKGYGHENYQEFIPNLVVEV